MISGTSKIWSKSGPVDLPTITKMLQAIQEAINRPNKPVIISPKIKKSLNLEGLVPHIIKSRFYWTKMKQNNSPELLNLLFKHIPHQNNRQITKHRINSFSHFPQLEHMAFATWICASWPKTCKMYKNESLHLESAATWLYTSWIGNLQVFASWNLHDMNLYIWAMGKLWDF